MNDFLAVAELHVEADSLIPHAELLHIYRGPEGVQALHIQLLGSKLAPHWTPDSKEVL